MALVIANSKYAGQAALNNPANDADLVAAALRELDFKVDIKKDQTQEQMEDALVSFRKRLTKGSLGLFYYAGHGLQVNGENYLVPIGARIQLESDAKHKCVPADQVLGAMAESDSSLRVLVLDCCRNNPFKRGWKRGLNDHGLAAMSEVPEGSLIAYSTAPGKEADDGEGQNSPYAAHFAATLRSHPEDGLELVQVFRQASQQVKRTTGQQPWLNMDASLPPYYLRPRSEDFSRVMSLPAEQLQPAGATVMPKLTATAYSREGKLRLDYLQFPLIVRPLDEEWFAVSGQNARVKRADVVALDEATVYYTDRIRENPANSIPYVFRAIAMQFAAGGRAIDKSMSDLDEAVRLDPRSAFARCFRGYFWGIKQDFDKARADLEEASRLDPKSPQTAFVRADIDFRRGDYDEALKGYGEFIRFNPANPFGWNGRGKISLKQGDLDKALRDFDEAIRIEPGFVAARSNRSIVWERKRDFGKQLADLDAAVAIRPASAPLRIDRANAYVKNGKLPSALADADEAIRLDPTYTLAFNFRGYCRCQSGQLDAGLEDYNTAIRLDPNWEVPKRNRAFTLVKKGDFDTALVEYDELIRLNPKSAELWNDRGTAHGRKGNLDAALSDYNEAIHLDPTSALALNHRASVWENKGDFDRALADLHEALRLDPQNRDAQKSLKRIEQKRASATKSLSK